MQIDAPAFSGAGSTGKMLLVMSNAIFKVKIIIKTFPAHLRRSPMDKI
jgi:hypothetical protein